MTIVRTEWQADILGVPYEQRTLPLGTDDEGEVVATLVRRRADIPTRRAVLYLHGFVDYFFQTHLADFFVERGFDFYALDLRKYGRSIRPHETPFFCRDLAEYFPDLDEAARIVREEDGHDTLLVDAHSTGGLIAPLWAHHTRDSALVDALALNSPFLDLNAPWLARTVVADAVGALGRFRPYAVLPLPGPPLYGRSIHRDHDGEWDFDVTWKPLAGTPVHAGWLRAVHRGHRQVHAGLAIDVPVLVTCSTATFRGKAWDESVLRSDAVLDVEHIAGNAHRLGLEVTLVRVEGGLHDLVLSPEPARARHFAVLDRWLRFALPPSE
ncbi:MAG TPA: alpha/beta hydrolase [Cryptosporangiaceae bacterium]|nr:alpha/beta hydrolase [Cryptosporangiaceae bacterium]